MTDTQPAIDSTASVPAAPALAPAPVPDTQDTTAPAGPEGQPEAPPEPVDPADISTVDMIDDFETESPDSAATLKSEWGNSYTANLSLAFAGIAEAATSELYDALDKAGVVNHPALMRAAANHARALGLAEDAALPASNPAPAPAAPASGGGQATTIRKRIGELQSRDDYWRNDAVQRETRRLYERLYGTGAIVGVNDRRN